MNSSQNKVILSYLRKKEFKKIHEDFGFYFSISGIVEKGKQLGRKIGFPTANLYFENDLPLPIGVYLCKVEIESQTFFGMGFYWKNELDKNTFETFIFNFSKNIYGKEIKIEMIEFIRDSIKIDSIEKLKELLTNDEKIIRKKINKEVL